MTFHIPAERQKFTWREVENLPVGEVEKWGNGYYILVCPLCGYLHPLSAVVKVDSSATGSTYKPNCAIAQKVHRGMYDKWTEQYPQARKFDVIRLIQRLPSIIPLSVPQTPLKQPYIAAGKAA